MDRTSKLCNPLYSPSTIVRLRDDIWDLRDTLQDTGSVITTLSTMGTTIVKGR